MSKISKSIWYFLPALRSVIVDIKDSKTMATCRMV